MNLLEAEVDPNEAGFDPARLQRLDSHFEQYVADQRLAGWQLAITRGGKLVHSSGRGHRNIATNADVSPDTIWRIYSMTKPITSVAAMMLWEEGAFELKDPISTFIPEFADCKVWRGGSVTRPDLEPLMRPIEMWHLMTHTSGLTYGFMYAHPVDELYRRGGFEWGTPQDADLAGICSKLAQQPLLFQPGTEWNYSMAIDVLGRIVEVISGQTLGEFLQERIFGPLDMSDTGFSVPEGNADRLAELYGTHPVTGAAFPLTAAGAGALIAPIAHLGGGGLVSTMSDYLNFAEMLRAEGTFNDSRLLSPRTVRFMTQNHLPGDADLTQFGRPLFSETAFDGVGFGLLGSVTMNPVAAKVPGSVGDYGWGGAASTFFWVDPVEDLTCVFMTQLLPSNTHPIRSQLKQLVHQAIVD
ncbi:MAG: serine hydrolase domain-containing protein [Ilumatobacteraceae bacterium]